MAVVLYYPYRFVAVFPRTNSVFRDRAAVNCYGNIDLISLMLFLVWPGPLDGVVPKGWLQKLVWRFLQNLGPATTQNLVVKFDGEIYGRVLVENASDNFPSKRSSKISCQTSPEVRHQFLRKLCKLQSGNRWCLTISANFPQNFRTLSWHNKTYFAKFCKVSAECSAKCSAQTPLR